MTWLSLWTSGRQKKFRVILQWRNMLLYWRKIVPPFRIWYRNRSATDSKSKHSIHDSWKDVSLVISMKLNGSPSYVFWTLHVVFQTLWGSILGMRTSKTDVKKMMVVMAEEKKGCLVWWTALLEATIFQ